MGKLTKRWKVHERCTTCRKNMMVEEWQHRPYTYVTRCLTCKTIKRRGIIRPRAK